MEYKICSNCGRELPFHSDYFQKRKRNKDGFEGVCRECQGKKFLVDKRTKRFNEVVSFVKNNSESKLLEDVFVNVDTKMKFQCKCGEIFETTFYKFKNRNKRKCSKCTNQEEWNSDNIADYLKNNSECELVKLRKIKKGSNYKTILCLRCGCGEIFESNIQDFIRKKSKCCNNCSEYKYYDIEMIKKYVEEESDCELIDKNFINITHPMRFICPCGNEFITTFRNFRIQNKRRCDECGYLMRVDKQLYTYEEVKEYIENNSGCLLVSSEYNGCYDKLELMCSCGELFRVSFDKFKNQGNRNKTRCNKCNNKESIPEREISNVLEKNKIRFIKQHRFDGCKYKNTLPFDFYLPDFNCCVEYDGEFHYKATTLGNDLKLQQLRDEIKTKYCYENNINLIRIPYWLQDDMENCLLDNLKCKKESCY